MLCPRRTSKKVVFPTEDGLMTDQCSGHSEKEGREKVRLGNRARFEGSSDTGCCLYNVAFFILTMGGFPL